MIVIDEPKFYPGRPLGYSWWAHLMTDDLSDNGVFDLHQFAREIGLKRSWCQCEDSDKIHYDVGGNVQKGGKWQQAVRHGAIPLEGEQLRQWTRARLQARTGQRRALR